MNDDIFVMSLLCLLTYKFRVLVNIEMVDYIWLQMILRRKQISDNKKSFSIKGYEYLYANYTIHILNNIKPLLKNE